MPRCNQTLLRHILLLITTTALSLPATSHPLKPPPIPILPLPSNPQLQWQLSQMSLFLHFGPNTFTDSEWGSGSTDPSLFNPTRFDPKQWVRVAKENGFSRVILTAKHHDGFCLWPSEYTDYTVRSSGWRGGGGDVVAEVAEAAREAGVGLGLYLSPWDRHEGCYGKTLEYNQFYMGQMRELLTRYGEIQQVFLDGAKGEGEKDMEYFFEDWFALIHQLQPGAVIFSDAGPDTRWVGDEAGVSGSTCWSLFNRTAAKIGGTDPLTQLLIISNPTHNLRLFGYRYSLNGDPHGHDWVPPECDVSIRPGWFWHASQLPKSATTLLDLYFKSVGRNCHLLLNVPPNSSGLISDEDIEVLEEFTRLRNSIFSHNLANTATLSASSTRGGSNDSRFSPTRVLEESLDGYWAPEEDQCFKWVIYIDFDESVAFNILKVQEPIQMGQRVIEFHLDALSEEGLWRKVVSGTTVGFQRLLRFPKVETLRLRFVIEKARAEPLISYLGIYMDSFSIFGNMSCMNNVYNGSQVLRQITRNHSRVAAV